MTRLLSPPHVSSSEGLEGSAITLWPSMTDFVSARTIVGWCGIEVQIRTGRDVMPRLSHLKLSSIELTLTREMRRVHPMPPASGGRSGGLGPCMSCRRLLPTPAKPWRSPLTNRDYLPNGPVENEPALPTYLLK